MDPDPDFKSLLFANGTNSNNVGLLIGLIVALVLLCALSFVTTLCEVAYREASPTKLRYYFRKPSGRLALKLVEKKDMVIMCNRLLDVLCTIAIVIVAIQIGTMTLQENFGWLVIFIAVLVAFLVAIVIGEVIPSAIAEQRPEKTAVVCSYLMTGIFYLFYPLTLLFYLFSKLVMKIFHIQAKADVSEKELRQMATDAYREGSIEKDEHDLVLNSLNFDDKTIEMVMVPLRNFSTITDDMSLDEICHIFEETNYSRIPVLDKENKEFVGILHQKDFYEMMLSKGKKDIDEIIKPTLYMNYNTICSTALKRFQALRQHMALVRRDGVVVGLITVEDLVEELVGDIEDEYDGEDIEEAKTKRLQARSDRADAQELNRRRGKFTDSVIVTLVDDTLQEEESDEDKAKD